MSEEPPHRSHTRCGCPDFNTRPLSDTPLCCAHGPEDHPFDPITCTRPCVRQWCRCTHYNPRTPPGTAALQSPVFTRPTLLAMRAATASCDAPVAGFCWPCGAVLVLVDMILALTGEADHAG